MPKMLLHWPPAPIQPVCKLRNNRRSPHNLPRSRLGDRPPGKASRVRATSRQHEKVQEFLSRVTQSVKRQVLIEATVAEVRAFSNDYQQGIDWSALMPGNTGFTLCRRPSARSPRHLQPAPALLANNATSSVGAIKGAVNLLEGFGTVKVLSSPKLSVMNNQTLS